MSIELRDYQIKHADQVTMSNSATVLAVLPTGGGKTATAAEVARRWGGRQVMFAHRRELIVQISFAFARAGVPHRILAPNATRAICIERQISRLGVSWVNDGADAAVASVDARADPWLRTVGLWQIDECFPKDTLIQTAYGQIPIHNIAIGDIVITHDGTFKTVTHVMRSLMPETMMKICYAHHELRCTSGHPILTKRGWINAVNLKANDYVHMHSMWQIDRKNKRTSEISVQKNRKYILYDKVRNGVERSESPSCCKKTTMYPMRFRNNNTPSKFMFEVRTRIQKKNIIKNNERYKSQIRIRTHEVKKSNAQNNKYRKNEKKLKTYKSSTIGKGRKWNWINRSRKNTNWTVQRDWSICDKNWKTKRIRLPLPLQSRCGNSANENCYRSGRLKSFDKNSQGKRFKTRQSFKWVRVDSVEVYKSTDNGEHGYCEGNNFVYNLEVESNHTYVANGIVVHNCHHTQPNNKWGRAIEACERAIRGVGWTATPMRADGGALAYSSGGIYHELIEGPNTTDLVGGGYITPVEVHGVPSALQRSAIQVSKTTGDFSSPALREATARARIYGDVVGHYLRLAAGLRGVTFCVDRGEAERQAETFRAAGVPAAALVDGIGDRARLEMLDAFERGELLQITSVDIIGEGLDIPTIGVVSLARATESAPLHYQQIGRVRRPAPEKRVGIVIDHVGNTLEHGLTDGIVSWSLTGGAKRRGNDGAGIPVRQCGRDGCWRVYESWRAECPHCGWSPAPAPSSVPSVVEGDLLLYTPELMQDLAQRAAEVARPAVRHGAPRSAAEAAIRNRVDERANAQTELRAMLNTWGARAVAELGESGAYRRFWHTFGVDAATALTLGAREARELQTKIIRDLA